MLNKIIALATLAALAALLQPTRVDAWGAAHVGYTHVGPAGVYHAGRTAGYGPGGYYSGGHVGAYGSGGASYHAGYGYGAGYGYHPYGGAYYGGYRYGVAPAGVYGAGVYRRW